MGKLKDWILAQSESMVDPDDECLSDESDYDDYQHQFINENGEQSNPMNVLIHRLNQQCSDENSDQNEMF